MILSDRTIREELAAGRIVIDPLDESCIQPSSVDLHVDRYFRVFRNHTMRVIDVKEQMEDLTELVEIGEDDHFVLHPGEFVLGSTAERVALPDDLVARLEGKSSLGRLGLLIHSSLPGTETVLVLAGGELRQLPIGDIVSKRIEGQVAGFDPQTFETRFFPITGWYEGPLDRIFEVRLASGRSVRVTAGHNLFTLDRDGAIKKLRTMELRAGTRVAIPGRLPDPALPAPVLRAADLAPEAAYDWLVVEGPAVDAALDAPDAVELLRQTGIKHVEYYRSRRSLPMNVARQIEGLLPRLGPDDRIRGRGARNGVPAHIDVTADVAWLLGIYVAEGYRRASQVVISNTDAAVLDRAQAVLQQLGLPVYRRDGVSVTCSSAVLSGLIDWLGAGGRAPHKRLPSAAIGWPLPLLEALCEGMLDGDGSRESGRISYWTSSPGLAADVLLLSQRLGRRASACFRARPGTVGLYQVQLPHNEHKLLTAVPVPDRLLVAIRKDLGLDQRTASRLAGYRHPTSLSNIEKRSDGGVRRQSLRAIRDGWRRADGTSSLLPRLDRLIDGDIAWDTVVEVVDLEQFEAVYDLEVRPGGAHIENFVAGAGGVFVSNTAGFVDAGWDGHLTLELSNVANLPITLYPGMKIGQISFLRMTTAADVPYGSKAVGSKYQGQRGPTPSRYFENFKPRD